MKQKFWFYVIFFLVIFNLISCTKQDVQILPPETQTGAGTFACIYNDESLVFEKGSSWSTLWTDTSGNYRMLDIRGVNTCPNNPRLIVMTINGPFAKGNNRYFFKFNRTINGAVEPLDNNFTYGTDSVNTGTLEITNFDIKNGIISGRFSFTAVGYPTTNCGLDSQPNPYINQKVKIGDGRFDLKMYVWK